MTTPNNVESSIEISVLQVKLNAAMETIERLEADKADWKQQAQSLARLAPPDGGRGETQKVAMVADKGRLVRKSPKSFNNQLSF
ncbi:hypothetical protein [Loktanella sp. R86503]|uniref:hypothetical protein n=1 Tax=Loktanella sp. R86503 TaxID=3093847 RepID=UPI0036D83292